MSTSNLSSRTAAATATPRIDAPPVAAPPVAGAFSRPAVEVDVANVPIRDHVRWGPIVAGVVTGLVAIQNQPHDVRKVEIVQRALHVGVDDIVRRGDDVAKRANVSQIVADAAEGLDSGHGETKAKNL